MLGKNKRYIEMIPTPRYCQQEQGLFRLNASVAIHWEGNRASAEMLTGHLRHRLRQCTGLELPVSSDSGQSPSRIKLQLFDNSKHNPENYELTVSADEVKVTGAYAGLLYGIEALCQLVWKQDAAWFLPCMQICDEPAFAWRGLMLDCSRHFLSKAFLLRCIDILPALRINRLHLHLNDDHGWRLEIGGYPNLTQTGAFVEPNTNRQGYYTQEDLREIVNYAAERNIMVVPEIEIPGHAYACMKSYPSLCCTGEPVRNPGHQKDLYCAGKESTFEFLQTVFSEVMEVFPSPYIHIGGDEAPKDRWRECPACQRRIREENLKDEEELQAYMIRRCANLVRSHGRQVICWEEVLNGNPTPDTVVQWWRHRSHGNHAIRTALAKGHPTISSPNSFCYLSFPVTPDEHFAPERTSDLRKVYSSALVPIDLSTEQRRGVLGAECCVWTEHLCEDDILSMLFPRVLASIELMWSDPDNRDYEAFLAKVFEAEAYWKSVGVNYGPYIENETKPKWVI